MLGSLPSLVFIAHAESRDANANANPDHPHPPTCARAHTDLCSHPPILWCSAGAVFLYTDNVIGNESEAQGFVKAILKSDTTDVTQIAKGAAAYPKANANQRVVAITQAELRINRCRHSEFRGGQGVSVNADHKRFDRGYERGRKRVRRWVPNLRRQGKGEDRRWFARRQ
jgi:hypothetical protein